MNTRAHCRHRDQIQWLSALTSTATRRRKLIIIFGILSFSLLFLFLSMPFILFTSGM